MTSRRTGLLLSMIAGLCLLGGLFGPGSASADHNGKVELAVGGRAFTSQPVGPLLDTGGLAPGVAVSTRFGVRSRFDVATQVSLQLINVRDDDNGCVPTEALVDRTCGSGQGELGQHLVITLEVATTPDGAYREAWRGTAGQLATMVSVGVGVPGVAERWLRLSVAVPSAVGNVVESDTFRFGLHVVLAGTGVSGGSQVGGTHTGGASTSGGTGGLAATGIATTLFVTGGALLIAAGGVLLSAGRTNRRRAGSNATSAGSSRERREPRPASPR